MERPANGALLTRPLGLEGWDHLESVLLASLVTETPLLLIGTHGTAKSFFLEKLARALNLEYRFYNTSLINYDDLVGIPIPNAERTRLDYISMPTAIWDAEVVFMDEINRTRPDLQNKVFPIIHERRIQGTELKKLRFRWAAMNPPFMESDSDDNPGYFGAEVLDTALADRFGFIVEVPSWNKLSEEEQQAILADQFSGEHDFPISLQDLMDRVRARYEALKSQRFREIELYLIILAKQLAERKILFSTRRMTMLHDNILANHAAEEVLAEIKGIPAPGMMDSCWTALLHSIPQRAEGSMPEPISIRASHVQAWRIMEGSEAGAEAILLRFTDPCERLEKALSMHKTISEEILGNTLINFLRSLNLEEGQSCALAFYLATHKEITLTNTALEVLGINLRNCFVQLPFEAPPHLTRLYDDLKRSRHQGARTKESDLNRYKANLAAITADHMVFYGYCRIDMQKYFEELYEKFTRALSGENN